MPEPTVALEVRTEVAGAVGHVHLRGRLGRHGAPLVASAVRSVVADGAGTVQVNLGQLTSIDGDGVAGIAEAQAVAADRGVGFVVSSLGDA